MLIFPFRPTTANIVQRQPTVVNATVPGVEVQAIDVVVDTGSVELPAFFVATDGNDSNIGTNEMEPFLTITAARDAMQGDGTRDTTYIRDGTYTISSVIDFSSSDANTSYIGFPGETPILDGDSGSHRIFNLQANCHGMTIKGITFQNLSGGGEGVAAAIGLTGCNDGTIETCTFDTLENAMYGGTSNGWEILGNTFNEIVEKSIRVLFSDNWTVAGNVGTEVGTGTSQRASWLDFGGNAEDWIVEYNEITGNNGRAIILSTGGSGNTNTMFNNVIQYNKFVDCSRTTPDGGAIYTVGRDGGSTASTIQFNWVENSGLTQSAGDEVTAIYLDDFSSGYTVRGNTCFGFGTAAIHLHGGKDLHVVNNVALIEEDNGIPFADEDQYFIWYQFIPTPAPGDPGKGGDGKMSGNTIEKNIVFSVLKGDLGTDRRTPRSFTEDTAPAIYIRSHSFAPGDETAIIQHNILFEDIAFDLGGETSSTQLDAGEGASLFTDLANKDFTLKSGGDGKTAALAEGFVEIDYTIIGLAGYDRSNY